MIKSILSMYFLLLTYGIKAQIVNRGTAYLSVETDYSAIYDFHNEKGAEFITDGRAYFYSDFNNEGSFDFLDRTGGSFFIGEDIQQLRSSETSYFYNITFDNSARTIPFRLSGNFVIENQADFKKGIIDSRHSGGLIIFGEDAKPVNPSNDGHVDGPLSKTGKTDFIYPIGNDGLYRPAKTAGLSGFAQFNMTYFHNNPDRAYPRKDKEKSIVAIDNREYWKIDKLESDSPDYQISLSWNTATAPFEFSNAAAGKDLVIAYWDTEKKLWVNLGGIINVDDHTITAHTQKFGVFTLAMMDNTERNCTIEVYNLIDVYGANENTYMRIHSDCAHIHKVMVFNRWGIKVFETTNYGLSGDVFDGHSSGRLTVAKSNHLPTGNYFYIIEYSYDKAKKSIHKRKQGFIYLNAD